MSERYTSNLVTRSAMKAELLDAETEQALARAWRDKRDEASLHRLTNAYMRLAIAMAVKFKRYGVPLNDLIQEAGLGLLKAADRFDPDRGVRFSTYAVWWIKAGMQDHVMRNWSLVRTGSTSAQKSLFFNLKRVEAQLQRDAQKAGETLDSHQLTEQIASEIGVSVSDVSMMQGRLAGADFSLNAVQGGEEDGREWIDVLEDENPEGSENVEKSRDLNTLREWLAEAMSILSERERHIVIERKMGDRARTLDVLGKELGVSKERVRQIEAAALTKMRQALQHHGPDLRQLMR
ncbi:RNA polymerase factor sigma-32 [Cognatishimia sp. 1_MG-2023]|uniref:RNA polymerase factor sigma-32 n=1 Tax=Cognatishimia sp. 1_MG-2023 TaxID=3062642 RepID=UPI0026E24209|nr:RNA polymerase factor sigma-32 [Cognatishimia sp. 1_MG-2023]MDO6726179.1 RNA polymerase factor sigma-32 [Cognatishimia sp. 1_MG-2023]